MSYVYYIAAPSLDLVKIGFATKPNIRLSKIGSDCPVAVELLAIESGGQEIEAQRHAQFASSRRRAEWFQLSGPVAEHVTTLKPHVKPVRQRQCTAMAEAVGISKSHASGILSGKTQPSEWMAIRIWRETGWKAPRIADISDQDLAVLERFARPRANWAA